MQHIFRNTLDHKYGLVPEVMLFTSASFFKLILKVRNYKTTVPNTGT